MIRFITALVHLLALRLSPNRAPARPQHTWGRAHNCQTYSYDAHTVIGSNGVRDPRCDWLLPGESLIIRYKSVPDVTKLLNARVHYTAEGANLLWQLEGLVPHAPGAPARSAAGWEVLGFVAPGEDFHLVRKDADGRLSHKRGRRPVARTRFGLPLWLPVWIWRGPGKRSYRYVGSYWYEPARLAAPPSPELVNQMRALAARV